MIVLIGFLCSSHKLKSFGSGFEDIDTLVGGRDCRHDWMEASVQDLSSESRLMMKRDLEAPWGFGAIYT